MQKKLENFDVFQIKDVSLYKNFRDYEFTENITYDRSIACRLCQSDLCTE